MIVLKPLPLLKKSTRKFCESTGKLFWIKSFVLLALVFLFEAKSHRLKKEKNKIDRVAKESVGQSEKFLDQENAAGLESACCGLSPCDFGSLEWLSKLQLPTQAGTDYLSYLLSRPPHGLFPRAERTQLHQEGVRILPGAGPWVLRVCEAVRQRRGPQHRPRVQSLDREAPGKSIISSLLYRFITQLGAIRRKHNVRWRYLSRMKNALF